MIGKLDRTDYFDAPIDIEVELSDEREPDSRDWEEIEDAIGEALDEIPYEFKVRSRRTGNKITSLPEEGKAEVTVIHDPDSTE
ncbi:MAG: hypothetical protein U5J64_01425 [Halobacteriales archaeon]|nr:hypothetical protein [Halobacteriales archaeon]